jgi:cytochrome c oxidase subunit 4
MSSPSHAIPDAHGHGHGGKDHVPHVLPLKVYLGAWGTLLVLTVLTVAASYFNFGTWNLVIALLIATLKAATVALLFMHLYFDNKFHAIILSSSLIFLAVFIGFTMFDTESRGVADAKEHERAGDSKNPFAKAAAAAAPAQIDVPLYNAGGPAGLGAAAPAAATPGGAAAGPSETPPGAASAAPATSGSSVPTLSSAGPAASAPPGAAPSASATYRPSVPGGDASFAKRPALRGDEPRGPAAALMASATGPAPAAPSASAAAPPKPAH